MEELKGEDLKELGILLASSDTAVCLSQCQECSPCNQCDCNDCADQCPD